MHFTCAALGGAPMWYGFPRAFAEILNALLGGAQTDVSVGSILVIAESSTLLRRHKHSFCSTLVTVALSSNAGFQSGSGRLIESIQFAGPSSRWC